MSSDIIIRPAEASDSTALHELIIELAHFERAPDAVINTPSAIAIHGWSDNPYFVAWVAELAGKVIGMALCYNRYSTWKGPVLYLEDLIVKEEYRGMGAGKRLFDTCLEYARNNKYSRMSWQVLDWNEPAINFYKIYGSEFDAEWVNCSIDLNNEPKT